MYIARECAKWAVCRSPGSNTNRGKLFMLQGLPLVRRLIVFSTSMKWKRVIIQGNQQPAREHVFWTRARSSQREMCWATTVSISSARCWSNFLGVGALLIYKLLDDEENTFSDLDKCASRALVMDVGPRLFTFISFGLLMVIIFQKHSNTSSEHIQESNQRFMLFFC